MVAKFLILSALVAAAAAVAIPVGLPIAKVAYAEAEQPANYEYSYSVHDGHTGDIKEQKEARSGYAVQGSYSLVQPDGVHRIVDYTADKEHGFNAIVRYEGTPIEHAPAKIAAPVANYAYAAAPVAKVAYAPAPISYAAAPVAKVAYASAPISYASPVTKIAYSAPVAKVAYAPAPITYASAPVAKVAYAENLGHVSYSSPTVTYHH